MKLNNLNPATVTYNSYKKDIYFTLLYLELKNTDNIKEIKEDTSKELKKETLREDSSLKYLIDFKRINLSQLINKKCFIVLYIVSQNRYKVNITIFNNIRANSFTFINTAYAINTIKFLNIKAT